MKHHRGVIEHPLKECLRDLVCNRLRTPKKEILKLPIFNSVHTHNSYYIATVYTYIKLLKVK